MKINALMVAVGFGPTYKKRLLNNIKTNKGYEKYDVLIITDLLHSNFLQLPGSIKITFDFNSFDLLYVEKLTYIDFILDSLNIKNSELSLIGVINNLLYIILCL